MISNRRFGLHLIPLITVAALTLLFVGCGGQTTLQAEQQAATEKIPIDLGNGMLEFNFPSQWPGSLVEYMSRHPDLKIVTIANGTSWNGMYSTWTRTMLVVVEPKSARSDLTP